MRIHCGKMQKLPTQADITSEQLSLSPEEDGIDGILAISHSLYKTNWQALPEHVHEGCIELCFCSRDSLVFDCAGETYTLMPNNVFLTQLGNRHHLTTNHKGMRMHWLFFRYPRKGRTALGLSVCETATLVNRPCNFARPTEAPPPSTVARHARNPCRASRRTADRPVPNRRPCAQTRR